MVAPVLASERSWHDNFTAWWFKHLGLTEQAAHTEWLYMFILWVCIISFAILMVAMFYFAWKYRRGNEKTNYVRSSSHNTPLELTWTIVPLIVMVPIFYWGFRGYADKIAAPADAEEITIKGQKWNWDITYKNGAGPMPPLGAAVQITKTNYDVPQFVVPAGRPVKFIMSSKDVIHAFYIPDFRTKMDVIPNRFTSMWFEASEAALTPRNEKGEFKNPDGTPSGHYVYCAEYCGDFHSEMAAVMNVVSWKEYQQIIDTWAKGYPDTENLVSVGRIVAQRKGCFACHSVDGSPNSGPTWKDLYRSPQEFTDGTSIPEADVNYMRESILLSQAKIVKGYPNNMPVYQGQINERELDALIAYIKSLAPAKISPEDKAKGEKTWGELNAAPAAPAAPGAN